MLSANSISSSEFIVNKKKSTAAPDAAQYAHTLTKNWKLTSFTNFICYQWFWWHGDVL